MLGKIVGIIALILLSFILFIIYACIKVNKDVEREYCMKEIWEMTLIELTDAMSKAEDQRLINRLALEITYRLYVPFANKTFEELLVENGYRIIEEEKNKSK